MHLAAWQKILLQSPAMESRYLCLIRYWYVRDTPAVLSTFNQDKTHILTYDWTPKADIFFNSDTTPAITNPLPPGTYTFYLDVVNQYNCTYHDSIIVGVIDTSPQADFVSSHQCAGYTVQFTNTSINAPYYLWNFGDPTNPNDYSVDEHPTYTYPDTGTYIVTLTVNANLLCRDTIMKEIQVTEPQIHVDFDYNLPECSDSIEVQFFDQSVNDQSTIISWEWHFGTLDTSTLQNPTFTLTESQNIPVTLIITSSDGCIDEIEKTIDFSYY